MKYAEFDLATGRILSTGSTSDPQAMIDAGMQVVFDALGTGAIISQQEHYVVAGVITARPACPVGITVAGLVVTLTGVPMGATLRVFGPCEGNIVQDDPDGSIEVTVPIGGRYGFEVDLFPTQAFSQTVNL